MKYAFRDFLYPLVSWLIKGQLCRCVLTGYQECGSTPDFRGCLLWHGCRADNIRNDCRLCCASQTTYIAREAGPVCDEISEFTSSVKFGKRGQYSQLKPYFVVHANFWSRTLFSPADTRYVHLARPLNGADHLSQTPPHGLLGEAKIRQALEQANAQQDLNRSLLRLTNILQQILHSGPSHYVIDLLLTNSALLEDLRKAHMGQYGIILSLLGCLDDGYKANKLIDKVIDSCTC